MTEGDDNVELSGNSGLYCAMTGGVVPLIDEQERDPQPGPGKRLST